MSWLNISFIAAANQAEELSEHLFTAGATAVNFENFESEEILEPKPNELKFWTRTKVIGLFDAKTDIQVVKFILNSLLPKNVFKTLDVETLEDKDWINMWLEDSEPLQFNKLHICPDKIIDENAINVMLKPGLGFGSGRHPTTALCLEWISEQDLSNKKVIDYGCGSGILGICAGKLNATVDLVDYDEQALSAAKENLKHNQIDGNCYLPEEFDDKDADILVANILLQPLIELKENFYKFLKDGGTLAVSGVLTNQKEKFINHYENLFEEFEIRIKESWCFILCRKKSQ